MMSINKETQESKGDKSMSEVFKLFASNFFDLKIEKELSNDCLKY